jgi:hypothetical protein
MRLKWFLHGTTIATAAIQIAALPNAAGAAALSRADTTMVPRCDSLRPAADSTHYTVFATLVAPMPLRYDNHNHPRPDTLSPAFAARIILAFQDNFPRVAPLPPNVYVPVHQGQSTDLAPVLFGEVVFSLTSDGRLARAEISQSSLSPEFDQSMIDALHHADSTNAFPAWSETGKTEPPWFFITISSGGHEPGLPVELFRVHAPTWHGGTIPQADPHHPLPRPAYPRELQAQGFEGTLIIQFVVDELGSPIPSTFRMVRPAHFERPPHVAVSQPNGEVHLSEFVSSVADMLSHARYMPGTVSGCAAKVFVAQPFDFKLPRR